MSARRAGSCGDPGPGRAHCTEPVGHRYSCYDAAEDTSWNDGQWRDGWFENSPHVCADPNCRPVGTGNPTPGGESNV